MTLDLDELERKAMALKDVASPDNKWGSAAVVILALIERVRELEARGNPPSLAAVYYDTERPWPAPKEAWDQSGRGIFQPERPASSGLDWSGE